MELHETEERLDLRKAVTEIARDFGHDYYVTKSLAGEKSSELWNAVGKQGFLGVNITEEYGGGGGGIYDMLIVGEELAAAGCPLLMTVVSPTICGTIIQAYGSDELKARSEQRKAAEAELAGLPAVKEEAAAKSDAA